MKLDHPSNNNNFNPMGSSLDQSSSHSSGSSRQKDSGISIVTKNTQDFLLNSFSSSSSSSSNSATVTATNSNDINPTKPQRNNHVQNSSSTVSAHHPYPKQFKKLNNSMNPNTLTPSSTTKSNSTTHWRNHNNIDNETIISKVNDIQNITFKNTYCTTTTLHHHQDIQFSLCIRQHPVRARAIGFSDRDRRPIDPPPIVQMNMFDKMGHPLHHYDNYTHLVCHISIIAADSDQDRTVVINPFAGNQIDKSSLSFPSSASSTSTGALTTSLVGNLVSPCYLLNDDQDERGFFFVFPEVSCRVSGTYRLRFLVFDLNVITIPLAPPYSSSPSGNTNNLNHPYSNYRNYKAINQPNLTSALANIVSDPFCVYHPKEFPGMTESTELSKTLSRQGVRIHIRNHDTRSFVPSSLSNSNMTNNNNATSYASMIPSITNSNDTSNHSNEYRNITIRPSTSTRQ